VFDIDFWLNLGALGLFIVAFIESVFFPLPPDIILILLALSSPENSLYFAFITTLGSALGSILGFYLGKFLGDKILSKLFRKEQIIKAKNIFTKHGSFGVFIAGFSPIPYKVFTILSGAMNFDIKKLFLIALISRGMRFFAEAILILHFGQDALTLLSENFEFAIIFSSILLILGYVLFILIKDKIKKFY